MSQSSRSLPQTLQERLADQDAHREEKASRTNQAKQVAEEYANDQREIIENLRRPI
jgi:hypothetical protein